MKLEEKCMTCDGKEKFTVPRRDMEPLVYACPGCGGLGKTPTTFGNDVLAFVKKHLKRILDV